MAQKQVSPSCSSNSSDTEECCSTYEPLKTSSKLPAKEFESGASTSVHHGALRSVSPTVQDETASVALGLAEGLENLLQTQRRDLLFELRNLQHGGRLVTNTDSRETLEGFFSEALGLSPRTEASNRPQSVTSEVNDLSERRPVSAVLGSQGFRRRMEAVMRGTLGRQDLESRRALQRRSATRPIAESGAAVSSNPLPPPVPVIPQRTTNQDAASSYPTPPTLPPAPQMQYLEPGRQQERPTGQPAVPQWQQPMQAQHRPTQPWQQQQQPWQQQQPLQQPWQQQQPQQQPWQQQQPLQQAWQQQQPQQQPWQQQQPLQQPWQPQQPWQTQQQPWQPQFPWQPQQQQPVEPQLPWLMQNSNGQLQPEEGSGVNLVAMLQQVHREESAAEISNLVQRQLVSSTLNSDFRGRLENTLLNRLAQTESDGLRVQNFIQSLQQTHRHRRNDFSHLGINTAPGSNRQAGASQGSNNAWSTPDMEAFRSQMTEMQIMLKLTFELQMDMQRSIRQEVAAALNRERYEESVNQAPMVTPISQPASEGNCVICLEQTVDAVLYQCGHMCSCLSCGLRLKALGSHCPMCRAPIRDVIRAYRCQIE